MRAETRGGEYGWPRSPPAPLGCFLRPHLCSPWKTIRPCVPRRAGNVLEAGWASYWRLGGGWFPWGQVPRRALQWLHPRQTTSIHPHP